METLRSVINQVKWFLFLLLLTVWGFACAFYILFRKDQKQSDVSCPCRLPVMRSRASVRHGMLSAHYNISLLICYPAAISQPPHGSRSLSQHSLKSWPCLALWPLCACTVQPCCTGRV